MRHVNASHITRAWGSAISRLARAALAIGAVCAVLASVVLNTVGVANAQELITNGNFSDGLTGWSPTDWGTGGTFGLNANGPASTAAASGSYAYAGGGTYNLLTQNVTLTTGSAYRLSFLAGAKSGQGSAFGVLSLRQDALGNYNAASFDYRPSDAAFGSYTVDFVADTTTTGVWLRSDGGTYEAYDNVSVTPIASVANAMNFSSASGYSVITSALTGSGKVTSNAGTGGLTLSAANTYTGGTEVTGGTLFVTGAGTLGAASGNVTVSGSGRLDLRNQQVRTGTISMVGENASVVSGDVNNPGSIVNNGVAFQFGGGQLSVPVSGSAGFNVTGGGSITGSNSYAGPTTISATPGWFGTNTLYVTNANALGAASGDLTISGGTVDLVNNTVTRTGNVTISGGSVHTGTLSKSSGVYGIQGGSIAATLAGAAGLTKSGAGTATLSGSNSYSGGTTVTSGTLTASHANALGDAAGAITVNTGGTLWVTANMTRTGTVTLNGGDLGGTGATFTNNGGGFVLAGSYAGAGNVVLAGSGGLTSSATDARLWAPATYTGATTVTNGTLMLGGAGGIPTTSAVSIASGAAINLTGFFAPNNINRTIGGLTGSGLLYGAGGTVTVNKTSGTDSFGGDIQGGQGLIKDGAGTLVLVGNSSYTGTTTVNQGTLAITTGNALGSTAAGTTVANGARLLLSPTSGNLTVGNEALTISGTGSSGWVLRSATGANTWGGKVSLAADATIQSASGASLTLDVTSGDALDVGNFTATFNGAGAHVVNDPISGSGGVTKAGSGILTLTGNSTYSGATTVSLGTLSVGSGGTSGSITGDIVNNASLIFNRSDALTYSGSIGGSGGLSKAGDGMLTLTGNSGYAGATAVDAGGLLVNGVHTGVGLVSVASGARIGGDGSLGGGLTLAVQAQFIFNSAATLDVAGAVTLDNSFSVGSLVSANGSAIDWGSIADGTYTLINTTSTFNNISNFGAGNAADIGGGRTAYFQNGSLQLVVVPEPSTFVMLGCIVACGGLLRCRRRASVAGQR